MSADVPVSMLGKADRNVARDLAEDLPQRLLVEVVALEREAARDHPAADVDADGGGDHRLDRRNHGTHRRADAEVHVGHRGDVMMDDRQPGNVEELLARLQLDFAGVDLHRHTAVGDFLNYGHEDPAQRKKRVTA